MELFGPETRCTRFFIELLPVERHKPQGMATLTGFYVLLMATAHAVPFHAGFKRRRIMALSRQAIAAHMALPVIVHKERLENKGLKSDW